MALLGVAGWVVGGAVSELAFLFSDFDRSFGIVSFMGGSGSLTDFEPICEARSIGIFTDSRVGMISRGEDESHRSCLRELGMGRRL